MARIWLKTIAIAISITGVFFAAEIKPTFAMCGSGTTCCGNGIIEENESCDDGNDVSGDGCDDDCTTTTDWACKGVPSACYPTQTGDWTPLAETARDIGTTATEIILIGGVVYIIYRCFWVLV